MKKLLAVLVSMLLLVMMIPMGAVSVNAEKSVSEIQTQISTIYQLSRNSHGKSFSGYCGAYVGWQLYHMGINTSYVGINGNETFDYYKNLSKSSGGYSITAYSASNYTLKSALYAITAGGTKNAYNIVIGLERGNTALAQTYGHTAFIHAIIDGVCYFSESSNIVWSYGTHPEGAAYALSIEKISDSLYMYAGSGYQPVFEGVIHFTKDVCSHTYTNSCDTTCNSCGATRIITHSYAAATCTKPMICTVCGAISGSALGHTYDNSCDATCNVCDEKREAGHNFSVVVTEATCSEYGKRCYTCVDCGYSYEEIVADYVSDWSTEYPTGVDEECIESKTEYRYRDREWKETTSKLTGDWILEGSYTRLGDFGPWSGWVNSPIAANDNTQVQTQKAYTYYYYLCPACGAHMHVYNQCYPWAGGCGSYAINSGNYVEVYSTTSYSGVQDFHGTGKYYAYVDGQLVFRHSNGEVTQYRSRTRQIETAYSYYRYTDWTDWGDEYNASNDTLEERTVYRYVIADLADHTYDNICDTDCNICGYTRIPTEHFYDDEYDATCNVCGDVREVPEKPPVTPDLPADAPTFVVESTDAREGEEFTVAIRTQRNSGIVSMKLSVAYDTDVLELIALEEQDFANVVFSPLPKNPFMVNWADAISPNNTTDGVVVLATFRVKEGAPLGKTEITLTYDPEDVYDENYDNVAFRVENGFVEIVDYIPGDVNADGRVNNKDLGLLQQYLSGWDVRVDEKAGDVNDDGRVNNKDLGLFQQYLSGWDVELG